MANNIPNLPNRPNQHQHEEKAKSKGNFWLVVIIILVVGAILWPILRKDTSSDANDSLNLDEEIATTTDLITTTDDVSVKGNNAPDLSVNQINVVKQTASVGNANTGPIALRVYFSNRKLDPTGSKCEVVYPTFRTISRTTAVGRAALTELLKGPTPAEVASGIFTSLNPGAKLQGLTIENGVARVDFSSELGQEVGGACLTSAIRAQITETLKQFSTVKSVVISINGVSADILQP